MKSKTSCPKCGAKEIKDDALFECSSILCGDLSGGPDYIEQSLLCKERVKVQRLKKQVDALKLKAENDKWYIGDLQKTVETLRNPKF